MILKIRPLESSNVVNCVYAVGTLVKNKLHKDDKWLPARFTCQHQYIGIIIHAAYKTTLNDKSILSPDGEFYKHVGYQIFWNRNLQVENKNFNNYDSDYYAAEICRWSTRVLWYYNDILEV